jgi:hypothetical protein
MIGGGVPTTAVFIFPLQFCLDPRLWRLRE